MVVFQNMYTQARQTIFYLLFLFCLFNKDHHKKCLGATSYTKSSFSRLLFAVDTLN
ncbi:hypothetical protein BD560DRAFT_390833 [Blakeslea trispora]|nr:hypothetical protein BD560DRAFT_390833 [Blakeslea trispora]